MLRYIKTLEVSSSSASPKELLVTQRQSLPLWVSVPSPGTCKQ